MQVFNYVINCGISVVSTWTKLMLLMVGIASQILM
jgi:hypothetical protein